MKDVWLENGEFPAIKTEKKCAIKNVRTLVKKKLTCQLQNNRTSLDRKKSNDSIDSDLKLLL